MATIISCVILLLPPARAFSIYIITLLFYPVYLVVPLGTLDISLARIVVTVLLLRCLLNARIRAKFKWRSLDWWVTFGAIANLCVALAAWKLPMAKSFENEAGHLTDTYFAYLAARLCLTDYKAVVTSIKWIAFALVPLAILGVIESYTGWQSFNILKVYCPWKQAVEPTLNIRSGFFRAIGPFSHPILFGAAFAMFFPMVYWLRHQGGSWRISSYVITGILAIGTLSSMSSGPVMMLIFTICFLLIERHKNYVKPILIFLAISCVLVEVLSNRTIWHVLASYADPIGGSGWHRAELIDIATERFSEWWIAGYGQQDPGWGSALGMTWTDITNHYIITGVKYGMLGVIALCGVLIVSVRMLIRLHNSTKSPLLRSWYWAMGSIIVAFIISFNAFTLFGQASTLFYCILGFVGSSANVSLNSDRIQLKHISL
ncbi:MAG: hypothetical protein KAS23_11055 [Anaerohalosphaera sp.]|nr:hypothetical protein [Anaerohalosphaera sp.]